jgi:hypothetical protein
LRNTTLPAGRAHAHLRLARRQHRLRTQMWRSSHFPVHEPEAAATSSAVEARAGLRFRFHRANVDAPRPATGSSSLAPATRPQLIAIRSRVLVHHSALITYRSSQSSLESSLESSFQSSLESVVERLLEGLLHRFFHRSSQGSEHRFSLRLLRSSVESLRQSSSESSTQSSFQGWFHGFFESSFEG